MLCMTRVGCSNVSSTVYYYDRHYKHVIYYMYVFIRVAKCYIVMVRKPFMKLTTYSQGVVGLNLVLSDKVFFSVDSGSLGHG